MSELKNAFVAAFPEEAPNPISRQSLVEHARAADSREKHRRYTLSRVRLTLGFGVASVVVIGGVMLFPSYSSAAYLRHVRQMITDAKSAHLTEWFVLPNGTKRKSREIWYQAGKWRTEAAGPDGNTTIRDGEKVWVYTPSSKSVRVSPDQGSGASGFTLTSMAADVRGSGKLQIKDEGALEHVTMENPIDNSVLTLWVDKKTDYPVRGEIGSHTPNGMQLNQEIEFEFNRPIPTNTFEPKFATDAKLIDESAGEAYWQAELSKVLVKLETPRGAIYGFDGKVILRNVQVTDAGDVFVVYSGQIDQSCFALKDSLGNDYTLSQGFQPEMRTLVGTPAAGEEPKSVHTKGFLIDGKPLNGVWFTPATLQTRPWKARTLNFVLTQHGFRVDPEKMKTWPKDKMVKQSDMIPVDTPLGSWNDPVKAPTCGLLPDYMPYMGMGPSREFDVQMADDEARFRYLEAAGRYAEAEPFMRDLIRLVDKEQQESGQRWVHTDWYFEMYQNLKWQNRLDEARSWLRKIQDEPGGARSREEIQKALDSEGLG